MANYTPISGRALATLNPDVVSPDISTPKNAEHATPRTKVQDGKPEVRSIGDISESASGAEDTIKKVVTSGLAVVGATMAAVIVAGLLSGIIQDYARKRRLRAGGGMFWGWLTTIPSLRHPCPPFALVEHREHGANNGTIKANTIYKDICLLPTLTTDTGVVILDDWGGWTRFELDTGSNRYVVTWIDTGTNELGAISEDGRYAIFGRASLESSLKYLYLSERI